MWPGKTGGRNQKLIPAGALSFGQIKKPGNDLLSHCQAAVREYALREYAVPSAEQGVNFRIGRAPPGGVGRDGGRHTSTVASDSATGGSGSRRLLRSRLPP
jgi:hypothetical protein